MWNLTKINKNHYKITRDDEYIEFELNSELDGEIVFNNDMSDDFIIFIAKTYPTPNEDSEPTIGDVYKYDNKKCISHSLVNANILETNLNKIKAKFILETELK